MTKAKKRHPGQAPVAPQKMIRKLKRTSKVTNFIGNLNRFISRLAEEMQISGADLRKKIAECDDELNLWEVEVYANFDEDGIVGLSNFTERPNPKYDEQQEKYEKTLAAYEKKRITYEQELKIREEEKKKKAAEMKEKIERATLKKLKKKYE